MQLDNEIVMKSIIENNDVSTLFVLRGFDIEECGYRRANLAQVIDNKIGRLIELASEPVKVVSFEEYLCFCDLAKSQYKKICVYDNAAYETLYPLNVIIPDEVISSLLAHFDEDADVNTEILPDEVLREYLDVFSNLMKTDNGLLCSYNDDSFVEDNTKVEFITIGEKIVTENEVSGSRYDYSTVISYPEAKEYMKRYWGYDEYRDLRIYDMEALEEGRKEVISISQEKIIGDMISQVENCYNGQPARDIFVTASTGAGKSLMFQLPAMYLADKYNLLTIVISPLIGLMNDQVQSLADKSYSRAKTINSDISPIIKEDILRQVAEGECDILYLSPESLLSRSDIEQLIGKRRIGMIIVDEAHIVTTWGKQFRPDYWFLGDHVRKLRSTQGKAKEDPMSFVIATFTATAIYGGNEDMYTETINSLHMIDPISYLGYVKRDNISIDVREVETKRNKVEYELDKFDALISRMHAALMLNEKTLIYFPTVALIERFYAYCHSKHLEVSVAKYHGRMLAEDKEQNFSDFLSGNKPVMIATKAFGMGIDIPDITNVIHYAPTGNVCDYMQEIGRAARDKSVEGHAIYEHMENDFQHINRLHGLSRLYCSQLIKVQNKILELFEDQLRSKDVDPRMKQRYEMLIDTESFAYIFDSPNSDDNELVNKVKTALLLIQKDYENRGIAPFRMRPSPLFADGYLAMTPQTQERINAEYKGTVELKDKKNNVCKVNLERIWKKSYQEKMSFPKFKYLLYTGSDELEFNKKYSFYTAMSIDIKMNPDGVDSYKKIVAVLKDIANISIRNNQFFSEDDIITEVVNKAGIRRLRAENIVRVILAAMTTYMEQYSTKMNHRCMDSRLFHEIVKYKFNTASYTFYNWIDRGLSLVLEESTDGIMYVTNEHNANRTKEILTVLGVLESMSVLTFKSLGGTNSQIYIYIASTKNLRIVKDRPESYRNRLLEMITDRHTASVKMLTYLFQNGFSSDEIWEHLENYFVGILPDAVK